MTILDALDRHAAARPNAFAVDNVSYGELREASLRVATHLRRLGIERGDRIVLYAENGIAFVYAYLGGLRAGAVVVPANVLYREADLARVCDDSGASAILVSAQSRPFAQAAYAGTLVDLATVARWASDSGTPVDTFAQPEGADLALLIYTSGTTGRAKGAMLTHGNLGAIAQQLGAAWHWTDVDTLLLTLPLFHVHGLAAGLNGTIVAGGRIRIRERFDANDVIATLQRGEATMFFGVPTMYVRMLETSATGSFPDVRLFVSGSAALPASIHDAFAARFGASILERYGATEFGFALTNRYDGARYAGTVGFPFPGVRARLVDKNDCDVPSNAVGELLVSGANVCQGYWQNGEATASAFFGDASGTRWYRSGDLATFDPERGYAIVGRTKELIISGGFNIYPREIEDQLVRIAGVRAAAVVGHSDPARGEIPVAFLETEDGVDVERVLATLRTQLASFKIPKRVERIEELPRNAMGKIDKPRLRALLAKSS